MKYKLLGRTGLFVSELCLGTMTFGKKSQALGFDLKAFGEINQEEANLLVNKAFDCGINFFDTAETYSNGESEKILGKALEKKRNDSVIATKVSGRFSSIPDNTRGLTRKRIVEAVEKSLKRLKTDYIDLYQIHTSDVCTPIEETLRALEDIIRSGKVRYVGCSNLMAWEIMKALGLASQQSYTRFESVQSYYSIAGRELEREIIPLVVDQEMGLLVWSPLAGGFLTDKAANANVEHDARHMQYNPPLVPPVDRELLGILYPVLKEIASAHNATISAVSIAWLLHQKAVTSVLIGAKRMEQLMENMSSVEIRLSDQELDMLAAASMLKTEYPQWLYQRPGKQI